jgi:hypothetical protein
MPSTLAIDIDLGRFTAWSTAKGVVAKSASAPPFDAMAEHETILIETVSPFMYGKTAAGSKGETVNRLRWMIFNSAWSASLYSAFPGALFAPSSAWTMGYPEEVRESMAGCKGKYNHDIRACICMVHFYGLAPSKWSSWPDHLQSILRK